MRGHASKFKVVPVHSAGDYAKILGDEFAAEGSAIIIDCNSVCGRGHRALADLRARRREEAAR